MFLQVLSHKPPIFEFIVEKHAGIIFDTRSLYQFNMTLLLSSAFVSETAMKLSLEGQTCCTVLYYDNVSNLTFHANEA